MNTETSKEIEKRKLTVEELRWKRREDIFCNKHNWGTVLIFLSRAADDLDKLFSRGLHEDVTFEERLETYRNFEWNLEEAKTILEGSYDK
tara:strand:+ start:188 stop:457 length:270 start_codon:yes stop_codon:yes gene_type:complete